MEKSKLNCIIDASMFLCMMGIAGIGLLMKYVLIPGRETWSKYGRKVELYFLGMDRHEWGSIHLYLALTLLTLLTVHIILHWQMILGLFKKLIPSESARSKIGWVYIIICLILIGFSFFVTPALQEGRQGRGRRLDTGKVISQDIDLFHLVREDSVPGVGLGTAVRLDAGLELSGERSAWPSLEN